MSGLIGRHAERARLESALEKARLGEGSIVLVGGEAGVGKTAARRGPRGRRRTPCCCAARRARAAPRPYSPVVAALRSHLRSAPGGLAIGGPLRAQLALLLPELGDPAPAADRPTLFEAMRCAFAHVAAERHALVVLDDLQWSDEATLELLAALAEPLRRAGGAGDRRLPLRRAAARPRRAAPAQRPAPHRPSRRAAAAPAGSRGHRPSCSRRRSASRPRRRSRARSTTAPRGSRSSSRSSPARCTSAARCRPGGAGSSSPATATSRSPRRCATRC